MHSHWLAEELPVDEVLAAVQVEARVEWPVLVRALVLTNPVPGVLVLHDAARMSLDWVACRTRRTRASGIA